MEQTYGPSTKENFQFIPPPEAPVFTPSETEFSNPLTYLNKIRPIAEQYGICKIKPPINWRPPFSLNVDQLRFEPREQCLNLLEAQTRVKINFWNQLATFWEMQGVTLTVPRFDEKVLDLYSLHKIVQENGGYVRVSRLEKWTLIATKLGVSIRYAKSLQFHYKKILYYYDVFLRSKDFVDTKNENDLKVTLENEEQEKISPICDKQSAVIENGEENHTETSDGVNVTKFCSELRRLKFYGAGPKMAVFSTVTGDRKRRSENSSLSKYSCNKCHKRNHDESMLICNSCDGSYHIYCLDSSTNQAFKTDNWFCPKCIREEMQKATEAYGFPQADREYNLQEFAIMADTFKQNYFNQPINMVSVATVEKEYWRIMSTIDEKVTVRYGADLHTVDHGSGFPTKQSENLSGSDLEYAKSNWNLNNLSVLDGTLLNYVSGDMSGIKLPWMYVGMLFSTFCWHIEDHWTYSVNYLHWGEPKTWYSVPGHCAEEFEECMKLYAPELFETQPDLLHQLVTTMNPNILMKHSIPVYRLDQNAGEFIITFPRAYHAGFNQGHNFAEAVNFAPPEWLSMGRECVKHYSSLRRICVFSHDELVCKMAESASELDPIIATVTYNDIITMVQEERQLRKMLLDWGVRKSNRFEFDKQSDDERQCYICNTTLFLSALTCECNGKFVCLRHYDALCSCLPSKTRFLYRHTLNEFPEMIQALKMRVESFEFWLQSVNEIYAKDPKPDLIELIALYTEAVENKFPERYYERLLESIEICEKCIRIIEILKVNQNNRNTDNKLNFEELVQLRTEIKDLPCKIDINYIEDLFNRADLFIYEARNECLAKNFFNKDNIQSIKRCIALGESLNMEFKEIDLLKIRMKQIQWILEVNNKPKNMQSLDKWIKNGNELPKHEIIIKKLQELQTILEKCQNWELEAKKSLSSKSIECLNEMKSLLCSAKTIPVDLPTCYILNDTYNLLDTWNKTFKLLNFRNMHYYLVQEIVTSGQNLPLKLSVVEHLARRMEQVDLWRIMLSKLFVLEKSPHNNLLEVLCPRTYKHVEIKYVNREIADNPIDQAYKKAEITELVMMKDLRRANANKIAQDDDALFCVCKGRKEDVMIKCNICYELYHINCVTLPQSVLDYISDFGYSNTAGMVCRYFCSTCLLSKRPKFDLVLEALAKLGNIKIWLDEGYALKCLSERYSKWLKRITEVLNSNDLLQVAQIDWDHSYSSNDTIKNNNNNNNNNNNDYLLADLILEGDLLEIDCNETCRMWKLIQKIESPSECFKLFYDYRNKSETVDLTLSDTENDSQFADEILAKLLIEEESGCDIKVEMCASSDCLRPRLDQSWGQCVCVKCQNWFHNICLKIELENVIVDYFVCNLCREKNL